MKRYRDRLIALIAIVVAFMSLVPASIAQTAPTPETTFTNSANTAWGTAGNWDNGLPQAGVSPSNALIQAGLTVDASAVAFENLTIGVGSRLNLNTTFPSGKDVYFSDASYLDMNGANDSADWFILPGANATNTLANDKIPGATLQGAGNLTVIVEGNIFWRKNCSGHSGNLTFLSNSGTSTRSVSMDSVMSQSTNILGPRINGFMNAHDRLPTSSTLKLEGGTQAGTSAVKYRLEYKDGQDYNQTIANLIVESPVGLTGTEPLIMATDGGNKLTVTDTVIFQGTADAVEIDDKTPASAGVLTSNMIFTGTGDWTIQGDCIIEFTGGTLTTITNATISSPLSGDFTKAGSATLTLDDADPLTLYTVTVSEGALAFTNSGSLAFSTIALTNSGTLNLDYAGTGGVLRLRFDGIEAAAGVWGPDGSGAPNTTNLITGTGFVMHNSGSVDNLFFWDGTDLPGDGELTSAGGSGTWNATTSNWDIGFVPHAAWGNTTNDKAFFNGSAGTVTLGSDMNIGELEIQIPNAGGTGYSIGNASENNTLTFGGTRLITITASGSASGNDHTIRAGIAGSPTVEVIARNDNASFFALEPPAGVTMTLGTLNMRNTLASNKQLRLGGQSNGNVVDRVTWAVAGQQLQVRKQDSTSGGADGSSWTISQDITLNAGRIYVDEGTLILGGTNNWVSHLVQVLDGGRMSLHGNMRIHDEDQDFQVLSGGIVSPGGIGSVATATFNWNSSRGDPAVGLVDLQTGSIYEWEVGPDGSNDLINLTEPVSGGNAELVLGDFVLKVLDGGGSPKANEQLPVFTYASGVTVNMTGFSNTNINFDVSAVPQWGEAENLSLTNVVADNTIYLIGINKPPSGTVLMIK